MCPYKFVLWPFVPHNLFRDSLLTLYILLVKRFFPQHFLSAAIWSYHSFFHSLFKAIFFATLFSKHLVPATICFATTCSKTDNFYQLVSPNFGPAAAMVYTTVHFFDNFFRNALFSRHFVFATFIFTSVCSATICTRLLISLHFVPATVIVSTTVCSATIYWPSLFRDTSFPRQFVLHDIIFRKWSFLWVFALTLCSSCNRHFTTLCSRKKLIQWQFV